MSTTPSPLDSFEFTTLTRDTMANGSTLEDLLKGSTPQVPSSVNPGLTPLELIDAKLLHSENSASGREALLVSLKLQLIGYR
jgi:hypothetical protein